MSVFDISDHQRWTEIQPDDVETEPPSANTPRSFVASAQRLVLKGKSTKREIDRSTTRVWQRSAWDFFDEIGEIKFAFSLKASIVSRLRLYPGVIVDRSEAPTPADEWEDAFTDAGLSTEMADAFVEAAIEALDFLDQGFSGGIAEMLRDSCLNMDVAGEYFLVQPDRRHFTIASIDELVVGSDGQYRLKQARDDNRSNSGKVLKKDTYVARVWRSHPRWGKEPDSSMRGVLDQCEKLVLLDRVVRTTARSSLPAGAIFIPDGVYVSSSTDELEDPLEQVLFDA